MCRIRAHCVVRKKGWVLTSDAPARAPSLRSSSFMRSLRIRDLQRLVENRLVSFSSPVRYLADVNLLGYLLGA